MGVPETRRMICPCRKVFPVFIGPSTNIQSSVFLYRRFQLLSTPFFVSPELLYERAYLLGRTAICRIRTTRQGFTGFSTTSVVTYQLAALRVMGTRCQTPGCKADSPPALAEQQLCVLHFTLSLEAGC